MQTEKQTEALRLLHLYGRMHCKNRALHPNQNKIALLQKILIEPPTKNPHKTLGHPLPLIHPTHVKQIKIIHQLTNLIPFSVHLQ